MFKNLKEKVINKAQEYSPENSTGKLTDFFSPLKQKNGASSAPPNSIKAENPSSRAPPTPPRPSQLSNGSSHPMQDNSSSIGAKDAPSRDEKAHFTKTIEGLRAQLRESEESHCQKVRKLCEVHRNELDANTSLIDSFQLKLREKEEETERLRHLLENAAENPNDSDGNHAAHNLEKQILEKNEVINFKSEQINELTLALSSVQAEWKDKLETAESIAKDLRSAKKQSESLLKNQAEVIQVLKSTMNQKDVELQEKSELISVLRNDLQSFMASKDSTELEEKAAIEDSSANELQELKNRVDDLLATLEAKTNSIDGLTATLDSIREEEKSKALLIDNLQSQVNSITKEKDTLQSSLQAIEMRLREATLSREENAGTNSALGLAIESLKDQLAQKDASELDLKQRCENLVEENEKLVVELEIVRESNGGLTSELELLNSVHLELKSELESVNISTDKFKSDTRLELQSLAESNAQLRSQLEDLSQCEQTLQAELEQKTIAECEHQREIARLTHANEELRAAVERLESNVSGVKSETDFVEDCSSAVGDEVESLQATILDLRAELDSFGSENVADLKATVDSLRETNCAMKDELEQKNEKIVNLQGEIGDLQQSHQELKLQVEDLQSENQELKIDFEKSSAEESSTAQMRVENLERVNEELKCQIASLEDANAELKSASIQADSLHLALKQELDEVRLQNAQLQTQMVDFERSCQQETDLWAAKVDEMELLVGRVEAEREALVEEKGEFEARIENLSGEILELERRAEASVKERSGVEEKHRKEIQKVLCDQENFQKVIEELSNDKIQFRNREKELKREIESVSQQVASFKIERENFEQETGRYQKEIFELQLLRDRILAEKEAVGEELVKSVKFRSGLEETISSLEKKDEAMTNQVNMQQREIRERETVLREKEGEFGSRLKEMQQRVDDLEREKVENEQERAKVKEAIGDFEREIFDFQAKIAAFEGREADFLQEIQVLKRARDELEKINCEVVEEKREIMRQFEELTAEHQLTIKIQNGKINDLKKTLQKEIRSSTEESASSVKASSLVGMISRGAALGERNDLTGSTSSSSHHSHAALNESVHSVGDLNFEYLKNVIFKFMVCNPSESKQLVTVLSTLLHFSPQQVQKLRLKYRN